MDNSAKYASLREQYPCFEYKGFEYGMEQGDFKVQFHFVCKEHSFSPTHVFKQKDFYSFSHLSKEQTELLLFNIGMIELVSYWKAFCSPTILIHSWRLNKEQTDFWRKIYFHGLGEFFFINSIDADIDSFVNFEFGGEREMQALDFDLEDKYIVPIGGGKDSVVTLDLLYGSGRDVRTLIVNPRGATLDCCKQAGIEQKDFLEDRRSIDAHLLDLNRQGYLNGHTPFSAMLAFTSLLFAAFSKRRHIALSNENSANESTIRGAKINHQYSKSIEFENDFRSYVSKYICKDFNYFSFLRPLSELHIAKLFSQLNYQYVFKSCNAGSKQDIWCGNCPKCLFAFIILSPFLAKDVLKAVFGKNLFEDENLLTYLMQLCGEGEQKPFECVGTIDEVNAAIAMRIHKEEPSQSEILLAKWLQLPVAKEYMERKSFDALFALQQEHNLSKEDFNILSNPYPAIKKAALRRIFKGHTPVILGFGREGKSSLKLLESISENQHIIVADQNADLLRQNAEKIDRNAEVKNQIPKTEYRAMTAEELSEGTLFLKTPGIPYKNINFIPTQKISSQTDLFLQLFHSQTIAISGTKGKSTTSSLIYKIIKDQNPDVVLAGNIGIPLFDMIDNIGEKTIIVAELSAHQAEFLHRSAHISVLLNLYEEHLDHFDSCANYWNAKFNLARKQSEGDFFVFNGEDERIEALLASCNIVSELRPFKSGDYVYLEPKYLKGDHNRLNALAALQVADILGLDKEQALQSIVNFEPLAHRLQPVGTINGVSYYNDSISTIPEATIAALQALKDVQTLILGGKDRGIDYGIIVEGLKKFEVKNIAFVGKAGQRMLSLIEQSGMQFNTLVSDNYEEIVRWCSKHTEKGKICLLSPAASSYDMFRNFEHRGEVFSELVKRIGKE